MRNIITILICLLLTVPCAADIITVDDDGPADFNNIQAAIDDAYDGDEIVVADGIYTGLDNKNIDFKGKGLTLRSENGPENCVIDCENNGRGFNFHSGESASSVLDGFKIVNGNSSNMSQWGSGGGIYCGSSSPTIVNCILESNLATYGGGMFIFSFSDPTVTNCRFANNTATDGGGGIYNSDNSDTVITNCIFTDNLAETDHGGGFLNANQGDPTLLHCTFAGNQAEEGNGGGVYNFNPHQSDITLTNCILWGNIGSTGIDELAQISGQAIVVDYSCIQGLTGGLGGIGNIDDDPLFRETDDYWLLSNSPCIDAGTDAGVYSDILGNLRPYDFPGVDNNGELPEFDMGAYETIVANTSPIADAGPDQTKYAWIDGFADVNLDGCGSYDDDNDVLDYYWSWTIDGNDYEANGVNPTIELPVGEHIIELVVNDGIDDSKPDEVVITVSPAVEASMKFTPQRLNCKGKGNWVKADIVLPEGISPNDVDVNEPAYAELPQATIDSEYIKLLSNDDGLVRLEIAFDRQVFCDLIKDDDSLEITVVGFLKTGQYFYSSDTIRIKH